MKHPPWPTISACSWKTSFITGSTSKSPLADTALRSQRGPQRSVRVARALAVGTGLVVDPLQLPGMLLRV